MKEVVSTRLKPDVIEKLDEKAEKERRTRAQMAEIILEDALTGPPKATIKKIEFKPPPVEAEIFEEALPWPTFEDFWNEYDKKVGSKEKIEKKWNKIPQKDKEFIMEYLPHYKQSRPDKKYRLNPETFINNKSWNDEIINTQQGGFNIDKVRGATENLVNQFLNKDT